MRRESIASLEQLADREPSYALVEGVDLVVVLHDEKVSVFYGRCLHRGVLLSDGRVEGENLICGVHNWDYRLDSGVSEYNNAEALPKFASWIEADGTITVDADEIAAWALAHPQPYNRENYQGLYADVHGTPEEPATSLIHQLAKQGPDGIGQHGPSLAMGVAPTELPRWDDLQFVVAQLARLPLLDDDPVGTDIVIGPRAKKPLRLEIPMFVSDMRFGALSEESKIALAKGAQAAGTGICSGEGGMLPEEQAANTRYFYELASARFGYSMDKVQLAQAFHFKGGQGAKTGTGGHLPGNKVTEKIAAVRGLEVGQTAISPSHFPDWNSIEPIRDFAQEVREATGGIPIGFKLSAQHIEDDIDAALEIGVDYIILDGRGGGTGSAPSIFREHISVPTLPALARARRHLDSSGASDVTLIVTGGLRTPADFCKAMALGADAVALSNSALQAIGCLAMRACNTNNCPVGIATQKEELRKRMEIAKSAKQLTNFFLASTKLMQVMARACGHTHLDQFELRDLTTWKREIAELTGVRFGGVA